MSLSNRELFSRALETLTEALRSRLGEGMPEELLERVEPLLLTPASRRSLEALREAVGKLLAGEPFSPFEARRAIEDARLVLEGTGIKVGLEELRHLEALARAREREEEERRLQKAVVLLKGGKLPPWWEVAPPHPEILRGEMDESEFAADLAGVAYGGGGRPEYRHPVEFFRRTYLTRGMRALLLEALRRLSGLGGSPVVQLRTAFGGGKTHTLLALYHLFSGQVPLSQFEDLQSLLREVGLPHLPTVGRAVLVGTAFDPVEPRLKPEGVRVRTPWGEVAYQLGGLEGYRMVREHDEKGVAPGGEILGRLLEAFGPALILIDEWVVFLRNLWGKEGLPASLESHLTFLHNLTEAARRTPLSLVVVTLPESEREAGGEGGVEVWARVQSILGRVESVWQPAEREEAYEIVRRRIFRPLSPEGHGVRDAVVEAFLDYYRRYAKAFPRRATEEEYRERFRRTYPLHPEVLDRLYEDWATIEGFQRTRGILRFVAATVKLLQEAGHAGPAILPGDLPLGPGQARMELLRYLDRHRTGFDVVLDRDVDGEGAASAEVDAADPELGRRILGRRMARAIFFASAPGAVAPTAVRGVEKGEVFLGTALPEEGLSLLEGGLKALNERLYYLYVSEGRYWFDTRPSLNRMALDLAARIPDHEAEEEILKVVREWGQSRKNSPFQAISYGPEGPEAVPDAPQFHLVVIPPSRGFVGRGPYKSVPLSDSPALRLAKAIYLNRASGGLAPRQYPGGLFFLLPLEKHRAHTFHLAKTALAWERLRDEGKGERSPADQRMVEERADTERKAFRRAVMDLYVYVGRVVPVEGKPLGLHEEEALTLEEVFLATNGNPNQIERAGNKVRGTWLDTYLPEEEILGRVLPRLKGPEDRLPVEEVWRDFFRYPSARMPADPGVVLSAIEALVREGRLAYGLGDKGPVKGAKLGLPIGLDGYLALPEAAQEPSPQEGGGEDPIVPPPPPPPPPPPLAKGTVVLRARGQGALSTLKTLLEQVEGHLRGLEGVEVGVEVFLRHKGGFPEEVLRGLREDARTLKVEMEEG